jgi:hypothetical protein
VKSYGYSGLYSGIWMNILSFLPETFLFFPGTMLPNLFSLIAYSKIEGLLTKVHKGSSFWSKFLLALTSTGLSQLALYPFNTIAKSQMVNPYFPFLRS